MMYIYRADPVYETDYFYDPDYLSGNGYAIGFDTQWLSSSVGYISNHRGHLTFDIIANVDNLTVADGFGTYASQSSTLIFTPSVSIPAGAGISVSPAYAYDHVISHAQIGWG